MISRHGGALLLDEAAHLAERAPGDPGVEVVGRLRQRGGRQAGRQLEQPVLDRAVLRHEDDERAAGIEPHELDVPEAGIGLGGHHDASAPRDARQQDGGHRQGGHESAQGGGVAHLRLDAQAHVPVDVADLHQRVDEEAQALMRGQPPGAGMRGEDEPGLLELGHDGADRCRREGDREQTGDVLGADRLAGREIRLDDLPEDLARALVELAEPAMARRRVGCPQGHGRRIGSSASAGQDATRSM